MFCVVMFCGVVLFCLIWMYWCDNGGRSDRGEDLYKCEYEVPRDLQLIF